MMSLGPPPFHKNALHSPEKRSLIVSIFFHGILVSLFWFDFLIPSHTHKPFTPTLRVDIIGLPDKNPTPPKTTVSKPEAPAVPEAPKPEPAEEKQEAPKDPPAKETDMVTKADTKKSKTDLKKVSKRNQSALARIKALKKIQDSRSEVSDTPIKGNILSKGTSLTGEAREAAEAHYYEIVQARLESNWALPAWLARSDYTAQVRIFIDGQGYVKKMVFLRTSGNPQFDEAIRRCIQASQPLPAPSSDMRMSVALSGIIVGFPL